MNRFLQILGIVSSLASFASVVLTKQYILAAVLFGVALVAIAVYVFRTRIRPIQYGVLSMRLEFVDETGNLAEFSKKYDLVANVDHISQLRDQNFAADGGMDGWRSNLSDDLTVLPEGGTKRLYTRLEYPLRVGKWVVHKVCCNVRNSFSETRESFSAMIDREYREASLTVKFHPDHLPTKVRTIVAEDGVVNVVDGTVTLVDNEATCSLSNPKKGQKCVVEWDW